MKRNLCWISEETTWIFISKGGWNNVSLTWVLSRHQAFPTCTYLSKYFCLTGKHSCRIWKKTEFLNTETQVWCRAWFALIALKSWSYYYSALMIIWTALASLSKEVLQTSIDDLYKCSVYSVVFLFYREGKPKAIYQKPVTQLWLGPCNLGFQWPVLQANMPIHCLLDTSQEWSSLPILCDSYWYTENGLCQCTGIPIISCVWKITLYCRAF